MLINIQDVTVELEYSTSTEPGLTRKVTIRETVPTGLALAVNVQDFFRGEWFVAFYS